MEEKYTFWWENLPEIWKKILTSHFYYLNEVKKDENDTKIIELGTLFFENNEDFYQLQELIRLKYSCKYEKNKINFIPFLGFLQKLIWVDLQGNDIENISSLSDLFLLRELNLSENQIIDVLPISNLLQMKELDLSWNKIENISHYCCGN